MAKILIVEDEKLVRELLKDNLEFEGYEVLDSPTLGDGDTKLRRHPDLLLLDVNLPDGDGINQLGIWRQAGVQIPVIVCTVKDREIDVVRALEGGADDYVTKPFRIRELLARIKAVLRRRGPPLPSTVCLGECEISLEARQANRAEVSINLTATEWTLFDFLYQNKNCVVSRDQIIEFVWGIKDLEDSRAVDVHVGRLRKKIDDPDTPRYLITVRGLGYKLIV